MISNQNNLQPGDYVFCIEGEKGDYEYSVYLYMAECAGCVICTAKYSNASDFETQLFLMARESKELDWVKVNIFPKDFCFRTKDGVEHAIRVMNAEGEDDENDE